MTVLLVRRDRRAEAVSMLKEALSHAAEDAYAQYKIGDLLTRLGANDEALAVARNVVKLEPKSAQARSWLGALLRIKGDVKGAHAAWREALRLSPDFVEPRTALSESLLEAGDPDTAIAVMREAVENHPDVPATYYHLGRIQYLAERREDAKASWKRAMELAPGYVEPRLGTVSLLWDERDYAGVEQTLREGLRLAPDKPDFANSLAWILATSPSAEHRNGQEAVKLAEQACAAVRYNNPQFLDTLAAAYAEAGRFEEAQKRARDAIQMGQAAGLPEESLADFRDRLGLYEQNKPYHGKEPAAAPN
jgi:tetratricopeptide (TPR) repeat protein